MRISKVASFCGALAVYGAAVPVIGLLDSTPAYAQSTSSILRGSIVSSDGSPVADASVEIVHLPSGTASRALTGQGGQFFQSGLRVGGPYRITVSGDGFQNEVIEGVFLDPGTQDPLAITIASTGPEVELEALQVTGSRLPAAVELNNGVGSSFSAEDIRNQPSVDRDVIRTLLRDPLAQSDGEGNLSVAGVNPRFNGLSIDGSLQQDDFGLGDSTYATSRSPINLDAIESVSLVATDYSVTSSGFTGGLVDVVTKSGGNEFDGTVYYAFQNDSMVGDSFDDQEVDPGDFEEKEYGFTLGGPIVKDKLFFFLSYDEYDASQPADFTISDINNGRDPAFFSELTRVVQEVYGFDLQGRPQTSAITETSERLLAKFDWNINYDHRASFTYQDTQENGTSVGADEFVSAWYDTPTDLKAYTFQLFSDWSYDFSTTFRVNLKEFERGQNCRAGAGVGMFEFAFDPEDLIGSPLEGLLTEERDTYTGGCDRFRHANEYSDERLQMFLSGEYFLGDHLLTFGTEYEQFDLRNLFISGGANGRFTFENFDELVNRTPSRVRYENFPTNDAAGGAAEWGYDKLSLFVSDNWAITRDFELTAGLRYERYSQSDEPVASQRTLELYGTDHTANLDGLDLIMPRVGFLWTPTDRTAVSGGFGLYAGGAPQVWVSNAFQNPTVFAQSRNVTNADIFNVPQELLDEVAAGNPIVIDGVAEDFETPSDWKASLRLDHRFDAQIGGFSLGEDWQFTAQYLYVATNDGFRWENLAQTQLGLATGVAPDGRPIYADLDDLDIPNYTELTNFSDGSSHTLSLALAKRWENGVSFNGSYAYQDIETVSDGSSSRGISNWRGMYDLDPNNPSARQSPYETEHSFKINLGYERNFFGDLSTRFDAFSRVFTESPWGATFNVDRNNAMFGRAGLGESPFDNKPLYIPNLSGDSRVVYGSDFEFDEFAQFVEEYGLEQGTTAGVYGQDAPWNNRLDVRISQELPGIPGMDRFVGDNKFRLILDIRNFLNLLNDEWGTYKIGPGGGFGQWGAVDADLVSAADVAANGIDGATALLGDAPRTTCTTADACVYRFVDFNGRPTAFTTSGRSVYEIRLTLRYDF